MPEQKVTEWPDYANAQRRKAALEAMEAARSGKAKEIGLSDWMEAKKSTAEQRDIKKRDPYGRESL